MKILWWRAAFLLFRFPTLLVAVVTVATITAITAASGPLFLAATEIGSLREGIDQATRWTAGYQVEYETFLGFEGEVSLRQANEYLDSFEPTRSRLTNRFREIEGVRGPYLTVIGSELEALTGVGAARTRLIMRDDALEHVAIESEADLQGVYLADVTAAALDVVPGDEIELEGAISRTSVAVAGIYRYLAHEPATPYWLPYADYIYRAPGGRVEVDPPVLMIAPLRVFERLTRELLDFGDFWYDFPLPSEELTLDDARELNRDFAAAGGDLPTTSTSFPSGSSALTSIVGAAEERITTVTPVVDLLSAAERIVALVVAAAAGFFLIKRRRVEVTTLAARGVGPVAQGLRYGTESLLPMVVGTLSRTGLAFGLVARFGPALKLPRSELGRAVGEVALTAVMAWIVLTLSAGVAAKREESNLAGAAHGLLRSRWLQLGTSIAVAIGVVAFYLRDRVGADDLKDPALTMVPVALILGGSVLAATIIMALLPRIAQRIRYSSPPFYLSAKRLAGASGMTRLLIVAGAWALGVAVYGFTMSSSINETTAAKAKLFVGSDFSTLVGGDRDIPDIGVPMTRVTKVDRAPLAAGGDVALIGIDPDTFQAAAFWDESFSETPLPELLADVKEGKVLTTTPLADATLQSRDDRASLLELARVDAFPGMTTSRPSLVMSSDRLEEAIREIGGTTSSREEELWAKGDPSEIEEELTQAGLFVSRPLSVEEVLETPGLRSLLWLLGLLAALGATAAIISVTSLLLYLQARERAALVASALTRRMGLSGGREMLSWVGEITGALMACLAIGTAVGLPVAVSMNPRLDPRPNLMPPPILVIPVVVILGLAAALFLVSGLMSWRVKRMADRADIAQVMRT